MSHKQRKEGREREPPTISINSENKIATGIPGMDDFRGEGRVNEPKNISNKLTSSFSSKSKSCLQSFWQISKETEINIKRTRFKHYLCERG